MWDASSFPPAINKSMTKLPPANTKSSRRSFCAASLGAGTALLLSPLNSLRTFAGANDDESLLPPANLREIDPNAFSDDELDMPFYVAHFHELANAVIMQGDNRGFISIPVWRNEKDNKPYNARIMENILSLTFFYVTKRSWNPFYGDQRLRRRLEAALDFWCRSQKDGRFSEYSEGGYNLPATAFATKFMGETLFLLRNNVPAIDADLLNRAREADRKAIETVFVSADLRRNGARCSNQYTNAYAGAFAYLDLYPDEALKKLLSNTIKEMGHEMQSPTGFFYENHGPDWSYNLGTHHSNLRMCWFYTRGTELGEVFLEEERRFLEWFSYNAVYDPASQGFWLNKQVETRKSFGYWHGYSAGKGNGNNGAFISEASLLASPFLPAKEDGLEWVKKTRAGFAKNGFNVPPLVRGSFSEFSPYQFLHRRHNMTYPDRAEKERAMPLLPYLNRERFTHQRLDSRFKTYFTFIRRPGYYLIFNAGTKSSNQQCFGMGLFWTPKDGVLLQSQRDPSPICGTRPEGSQKVVECDAFQPTFFSGNKEVQPKAGIQEWGDAPFRVQYGLKPEGKKVLECSDDAIRITVDCPGRFTECFPFFLESGKKYPLDRSQFVAGGSKLSFTGALAAQIKETDLKVGGKKLFLLEVSAADHLEYILS